MGISSIISRFAGRGSRGSAMGGTGTGTTGGSRDAAIGRGVRSLFRRFGR